MANLLAVPEKKLRPEIADQIHKRLGYLVKDLDLNQWEYDQDEADRFIYFCRNHIKLTSGEWKGKQFEPLWWQEYLWFRPVFGWREVGTGFRMIQESDVIIPKKNGKTESQATISLYGLTADKVETPEIYNVAGDEDQANTLFKACADMVEADPFLRSICKVWRSSGLIECKRTGGILRRCTSAPETKDGFRPSMATVDEAHVLKDDSLINIFLFGMGSRSQRLMTVISTFGKEMTNTPLEKIVDHGEKLVAGDIKNNRHHFLIFRAPETERENWDQPRVWAIANPTYPETPKHDFLVQMSLKARTDVSIKRESLQKYLNMDSQADDSFLDAEQWKSCRLGPWIDNETPRLGWEHLTQPVIGIDLADVDDLTALVAASYHDSLVYAKSFFWIPADSISRRAAIRQKVYLDWRDRGALITVPGQTMPPDYEPVVEKCLWIREQCGAKQVRLDPNKAGLLSQRLIKEGFEVVYVPQSFPKMGPATRMVKTLTLSGKILHDDNPVLNSCMKFAKVKKGSAGDYILDKARVSEKIDGATGLALAVSGLITELEDEDLSKHYEEFGIEFL